MQEKTIMAKVPQEKHTELHVKARLIGLSLAEIIRRFLFGWLSGEVELPSGTDTSSTE